MQMFPKISLCPRCSKWDIWQRPKETSQRMPWMTRILRKDHPETLTAPGSRSQCPMDQMPPIQGQNYRSRVPPSGHPHPGTQDPHKSKTEWVLMLLKLANSRDLLVHPSFLKSHSPTLGSSCQKSGVSESPRGSSWDEDPLSFSPLWKVKKQLPKSGLCQPIASSPGNKPWIWSSIQTIWKQKWATFGLILPCSESTSEDSEPWQDDLSSLLN